MFSASKQLLPPTATELCAVGCFINPKRPSLVLARRNRIQVYDVVRLRQHDGSTTERMELVHEWPLYGVVSSMALVPQTGKTDLLLLAFPEAKMSIVEFSLQTHDLATVSLHYYEHDKYKEVHQDAWCPPVVRVDPGSRCTIMKFYHDRFAILPFRQADDVLIDEGGDTTELPPYESSYVVTAAQIDERIKNVIDFTFLNGFYEPTMAVLFEPKETWTGRLNKQRDTVSMMVISMDVINRTYTVINHQHNLPYDAFAVAPVPLPVGGMLVFGTNELMHFDQVSAGTGVALNAFARECTAFNLKDQSDLCISLEDARHVFLSPNRLLLALGNGDFYRVTLEKEGRSVNQFGIEKIAQDVATASCMAPLGPHHVFLGSTVADSLLICYVQQHQQSATGPIGSLAQSSFTATASGAGNTVDELDELDILMSAEDLATDAKPNVADNELSNDNSKLENGDRVDDGGTALGDTLLPDFKLSVVDRLLSLGPSVDLAIGIASVSDEYGRSENAVDPLDLVACTGKDMHGALGIAQQSIRPIIRSSFKLPDKLLASWTLTCRNEVADANDATEYGIAAGEDAPDATKDDDHHTFLLMSKISDSEDAKPYSVVLSTGESLTEINYGSFHTGLTVAAGEMFGKTRVVQIHSHGVLLLDSDARVRQSIKLAEEVEGRHVHSASIQEPYVAILMDDGCVRLLEADEVKRELKVVAVPNSFSSATILACSVFKDDSGMFQSATKPKVSARKKTETKNVDRQERPSKIRKIDHAEEIMDLDTDIYGGGGNDSNRSTLANNHAADCIWDCSVQQETPASATFWLALYKSNGSLEIYALPSLKLVYHVAGFNQMLSILSDSQASAPAGADGSKANGIVSDLLIVTLGAPHRRRPFIFVHTNKRDLIIYECFAVDSVAQAVSADRLPIRFRRIEHDLVTRSPHDGSAVSTTDIPTPPDETTTKLNAWQRSLIPFYRIRGSNSEKFEGVFVTGDRPAWIFIGNRNALRMHPMTTIDGPVFHFAQFHNINCPNGFLFFNQFGELRIGELDREMNYDHDWPTRKVYINPTPLLTADGRDPLEDGKYRTPRKISFHPVSNQYCVLTSTPAPFQIKRDEMPPVEKPGEYRPMNEEQEAAVEKTGPKFELAPGKFLPSTRKYTLELFSPYNWTMIDSIDFGEHERAMCMVNCVLDVKVSGMLKKKHFIVVGTAFTKGEDVTSRGRIYMYEVIDVVPEPGRPETNHKLKLVKSEEAKGSVSAICTLNGYLCVAMGPKIMMYSFEDGEKLTGVAFMDIGIYIKAMRAVKSFLIVGDIQKSVWLLGFQEDPNKLHLLSKDFQNCPVLDAEFFIDQTLMGFIMSDQNGNVQIFQYNPSHIASFRGQKLIKKGDWNVNSEATRLLRISKRAVVDGKTELLKQQAAADGSIGYIVPLGEKAYKRLQDISTELCNRLEHHAGLNPKSFRMYRALKKFNANPTRNVLDGDFVGRFAGLSAVDQVKWARNRGTSADRVLEDLREIQQSMDFF